MAGTIREIAQLAGVSRGTVDRALNHRGRVNPEVAERIWKIAEELEYHPGRKYTGHLDEDKPLKIGVVTQMSESPFMIQIRRGLSDIQKELKERGVCIFQENMNSVNEEEQLQAIARLEEEGVCGLAIMPIECDRVRDSLNRLIEKTRMPVVTFNTDIIGTKRDCFVGLDNRKSGYTAAGLMGMLTRGAGKVLIVTGSFTNSTNSHRVEGFIEEIKQSFPGIELLGVQGSSGDAGEVEQIILTTMEREPDLAGIFVACMGQEGVSRAFEKMHLKKRPYVIVYDITPQNERALEADQIDFLIDQEGYRQGYQAVRLLYDYLTRNKDLKPELMLTDIRIVTKYNIRG